MVAHEQRRDLSMSRFTFTSESVTEGHPDKMCDQISDAVLDGMFEQDPYSRVACESMVTTGLTIVAGEISSKAQLDLPRLVRDTIRAIGYTDASFGFDGSSCAVITSIDEQSSDIAQGVDKAWELRTGDGDRYDEVGAGDQGMMFGYACDETADLMPLPIWFAHRLAQRLAAVRRDGTVPFIRPDGKTQVTIEYEDGVPRRLCTVLISTQHDPGVSIDETLKPALVEHVVRPLLPEQFAADDFEMLVNPTGSFEKGGPHADAGLTGRKIIVDTYGGMARHGGGAFSGKDPTKVDRSGAYAVRNVAKNVVAAGIAKRCEVQVAYAIGIARPVSVMVETFGTSQIDPNKLGALVHDHFDLRPAAIIERLDLRRPIYQKTAAYGHFGRREPTFTWERTDEAEELRKAAEALA
jgi:S-adenosylmethionine synthetase